MALTYTRAGAQAQLDAFDTALRARDWAAAQDALNSFKLIRTQLVNSSALDGFAQSWPDSSELEEMLSTTRAEASRATDQGRRVGYGRVGYGR